jgi:hypothetical protein
MKNKIFILFSGILSTFDILNLLAWGGFINVFWQSNDNLFSDLSDSLLIILLISMWLVNRKPKKRMNNN